MTAINNFDEYCRALAGGEQFNRASLIKFLRGQMIILQKLENVRDEEKYGFVGLTEITNIEDEYAGDELTRIAESTLDAVRHISGSFRQKIIRENVLMPMYQAKEINSSGISWLSKRSGRTIREKLSSTNNLLAVRRRMSFDTGENRLYLAFLRQIEEYIEQKRLANSSFQTALEYEFQQLVLKILHDDELEEVGLWENTPPNNTLLSDKFYRQIWHGWTDLQNLSEMICEDSQHLDERLCTAYFCRLLRELACHEKFPQQPIKYDYAKFEVRPLHKNSIVSENLTVTKLATRIEIRRGTKIFAVEFQDMTIFFCEDGSELLHTELTVGKFVDSVRKTAEFICGVPTNLKHKSCSANLSAAKKNYMDIFAIRPLYTAPNGKIRHFKSRIIRQEFFDEKETFDLSAEFSTALTVAEDSSSKIYSLSSCINERKTSNEKFNRLLQMIHEKFFGSNQQIEQLSLPLPDLYNEFQLSAIRRAVRINYNHVQTMPRSLAILFWEMSRNSCEKFSDGDFALVVDYICGRISLTLIQARFDSQIKEALPKTCGLIWERHPTFSKVCELENYADFEKKFNDFLLKSGWKTSNAVLDKILNVFGVKGLPTETGLLTFQFSNTTDETWTSITDTLMEKFKQIKFDATDIIKEYLKQMVAIIGRHKVFKFIISPQLTFIGSNAISCPKAEIPLLGMKFYDELQSRAQSFEETMHEKLPPLWTDRLPFLAIKRFYGTFELIGRNSNKKVAPLFGITQKIPVEETFTLTKNCDEYRFGLILNDSKEISYEAVVRNHAFPLRQDVICELHLTYTYGKDIPYELIFKPLNSQSFNEAKVTWEDARGQDYQNLPVPPFPEDTENWQTLQHLCTHTGNEWDALNWIKETFRHSIIIDFDNAEYHYDDHNPFVFVKTEIDDKPSIIQIHKSEFGEDDLEGVWSLFIVPNTKKRYEIYLNDDDWNLGRNGYYCLKEIAGKTVAFYKNNFLFDEETDDLTCVTFEIFKSKQPGKYYAGNLLVDDEHFNFYYADEAIKGYMPYDLKKFSIMYPLHKVYANGRSSKTPGCPESFRYFIEQLVQALPQDVITAKNNNIDLFKKLLRIMCVMSADFGQSFYDLLQKFLAEEHKLIDSTDLGCALGDYDTDQQRQLFWQIHGSEMNYIEKICVLNNAAWKSERFILNVPPAILLEYQKNAINYLKKNMRNKVSPLGILNCLEFIFATFRLRGKNDDTLKEKLSLNHDNIQELYDTLEDMISDKYELPPSRIELKIKKSAEYSEISDLYYALLICITGGEDEIRITAVRNDIDEDSSILKTGYKM